jgi:hypothetical protein
MKKETIENWAEEFDEKIGEIFGENKTLKEEGDFPYLPNWLSKRNRKIKSFIRQLLSQEKEKLLDRIKLEKKPKIKGNNFDEANRRFGYNQAIDELEKLKNQLKDEE